ncbi:MAG: DUF4328 domain-containing protein [Phycisphaerales bacterium]|nr:DUF4328 domain-containing protein [Phycisphaerales bacterium]
MTATGSTTYLLDEQTPSPLGLQRKAGWIMIGGTCLGTAAFSLLIALAFIVEMDWVRLSSDQGELLGTSLIMARDVMYLAGGIAAMVWMYAAYKRLPQFTGRPNQRKNWWAWAGMLIPGPCLFVPFRIARELASGSRDGEAACSPRLVGVAQASIVIALLAAAATVSLAYAGISQEVVTIAVVLTMAATNVLATIAWSILVLKINKAQEESLA